MNFFRQLLALLVAQLLLLQLLSHSSWLNSWPTQALLALVIALLMAGLAAFRTSFNKVNAEKPAKKAPTFPAHIQLNSDPLTGLVTRLTFRKQLAEALNLAHQQRAPLTLLFLDLDNFKYVNDKHGYEVGDRLLQSVAKRLSYLSSRQFEASACAPWLARLSGDEFALVLPQVTATQAEPVLHKIQELFWQGFQFELGTFPISTSIGVASFPLDGHTVSQLVSNAEMAMGQAKSSGNNRYKIYSYQLARIARRHHEIEQELKHASFDQEFSLHYMPIVDRKGRVHSCEALVRWTSPQLGPVYPDEFIPIAEASGLFRQIDLWVARQAMIDLPKLKQLFGPELLLAINISSAELSSHSFYREFVSLTQQSGIQPQHIELEITETFAKEHSEAVLDRLAGLQQKGFSIAIDDFGSGYTSLIQMVDFPVDRVKFDKSLVERLCTESKERLLGSLVQLCHQQAITIVAEGVETQAQQQALLKAGVDYLQGYLFAKPMPLNELKIWASLQSAAVIQEQITKSAKLPKRRTLIGLEAFAAPLPRRRAPETQDAKAYRRFLV